MTGVTFCFAKLNEVTAAIMFELINFKTSSTPLYFTHISSDTNFDIPRLKKESSSLVTTIFVFRSFVKTLVYRVDMILCIL